MPHDITTAAFRQEVLEAKVPVLVDFWATYCPPCRQLAPELDAVAAEFGERAKIVKINAPEEPDLAQEYGISGVPTLLLFQDGRVVRRLVGFHNRHQLRAVLAGA